MKYLELFSLCNLEESNVTLRIKVLTVKDLIEYVKLKSKMFWNSMSGEKIWKWSNTVPLIYELKMKPVCWWIKYFFSGNKKDITYEIPRKWDSRLSSFQSLDNLCLLYYPTSMLCLYSKVRKIKNYKIIPSKLQKDSNNVKSIFVFINFKVNIQKIGIIIMLSYT